MTNSEQVLAGHVAAWLKADGWTVHEEVECGGARIDLVGLRAPCSMAIECKTSFGLAVAEQAWKLTTQPSAHFVAIATPLPKRVNQFLLSLCRQYGIGVLFVHDLGFEDLAPYVRWRHEPQLRRRGKARYWAADNCVEGNLFSGLAGTNKGGHWTPFRETVKRAKAFIGKNPGCTTRELIDSIDHHYASDKAARTTLVARIHQGVIEGIEIRKDGNLNRFYLED